jgi:hypothetical protein
MERARILAYIARIVDQQLLLRKEYLAAENRMILKGYWVPTTRFSLTGATSAKRVGPTSRTWSATGRDAGPVQASLEGVPARLPCGNIEPPAISCFARPPP